ncbi:MAG TPA: DUF2752 domain-containing protein [Edaphobacter sp.]
MNVAPHSRAVNITRAAIPLIVIVIAASLLLFPPTRYTFYPQCPIYRSFHLLCPGCGTTRALAALLRGHLREAFHLNAFTTLMFPIAIAYAARSYSCLLRRKTIRWPQPPAATIYTMLAIAVIFTIARNT